MGALYLREGCPSQGTLSALIARPWGKRPGPAASFLWVPGQWAWGPVTPQRTLLRAGFAPCWGGTRWPGGGVPCLHERCPG